MLGTRGRFMMKKNACTLKNKEYEDGAEVCDALRCMVCRDGTWDTSRIMPYGP